MINFKRFSSMIFMLFYEKMAMLCETFRQWRKDIGTQ